MVEFSLLGGVEAEFKYLQAESIFAACMSA